MMLKFYLWVMGWSGAISAWAFRKQAAIVREHNRKDEENYLKELKKKGLVKIENFSRQKNKISYLRYVITPAGIDERVKLTLNFMKRKMKEYDELKKELGEDKR